MSFADRGGLSAQIVTLSLGDRRTRLATIGRIYWHDRRRPSWQIVQNPNGSRRRACDRVGPRRLCDDKRVVATAGAGARASQARGTTAAKTLLGDRL